jgi:hypothetical protein
MKIEQKKTSELIPYARNSRTHDEKQVSQIASSIKEFGFNNPVLIDGDNGIIAGHGRVMAAQLLKLETVPTIELSHLSDTQKRAYIIADNKIALNSGWDDEMLKLEMIELNDLDFNLELTGFDDFVLDDVDNTGAGTLDDKKYTAKTDVFTYEPTGEKPELSALFDDTKTKELLEEIKKSDLGEKEKAFLTVAAYRHTVFNFEQIANYYAHSEIESQNLMEQSALVIVDFDDAIAGGFVQLTKELQQLVADNE